MRSKYGLKLLTQNKTSGEIQWNWSSSIRLLMTSCFQKPCQLSLKQIRCCWLYSWQSEDSDVALCRALQGCRPLHHLAFASAHGPGIALAFACATEERRHRPNCPESFATMRKADSIQIPVGVLVETVQGCLHISKDSLQRSVCLVLMLQQLLATQVNNPDTYQALLYSSGIHIECQWPYGSGNHPSSHTTTLGIVPDEQEAEGVVHDLSTAPLVSHTWASADEDGLMEWDAAIKHKGQSPGSCWPTLRPPHRWACSLTIKLVHHLVLPASHSKETQQIPTLSVYCLSLYASSAALHLCARVTATLHTQRIRTKGSKHLQAFPYLCMTCIDGIIWNTMILPISETNWIWEDGLPQRNQSEHRQACMCVCE